LKTDADRISRKTSTGTDEFAEKTEGFEPYVYRMRKTEDGKCLFLKENSCSIYQTRPLICRFYPFQLKNLRNRGYAFSHTDECPGIGKGPLLRREFFGKLFRESVESTSAPRIQQPRKSRKSQNS
jgi:Fe-S-cluster containining protein